MPKRAVAITLLAFALAMIGAGPASAGKPAPPSTITWSGRTWQMKSSQGKVGPGPNYFSASSENVSVDTQGRLHLRITYRNGRWNCAEIVSTETLGYGTYAFDLGSAVDHLDPNVVLGLFTWSDKAAYNHREIDIELSRWGNAADPTNAQYVVQPYDLAGHLQRWTLPAGAVPSTHDFKWQANRVDFMSFGPSGWTNTWSFTGSGVPRSGGENVRLNLWLSAGLAPTDGQDVEVIVDGFGFAR